MSKQSGVVHLTITSKTASVTSLTRDIQDADGGAVGRGLHSSTFRLNLSRF